MKTLNEYRKEIEESCEGIRLAKTIEDMELYEIDLYSTANDLLKKAAELEDDGLPITNYRLLAKSALDSYQELVGDFWKTYVRKVRTENKKSIDGKLSSSYTIDELNYWRLPE